MGLTGQTGWGALQSGDFSERGCWQGSRPTRRGMALRWAQLVQSFGKEDGLSDSRLRLMPLAWVPPEPGRLACRGRIWGPPHVVTAPGTAPHHGSSSLTDRSGHWSLLGQQGGAACQEGDSGHPDDEGGEASRVAHSPGVTGASPSVHYLEG